MKSIVRAVKTRYWLLAGLLIGLAVTTVVSSGALTGRLSEDRRGVDPLSMAEIRRAEELALASAMLQRELEGVNRQRLLHVERHPESKEERRVGDWDRRVDVFVYDYENDVLLTTKVNLTSNQVESLQMSYDTQLPLTPDEAEQALAIAFADSDLRARMDGEFERISGQALRGPEQVNIKAFVFRADAMPGATPRGALRCGTSRCAQLLLFTRDEVVFEILPIINLSRGSVEGVVGALQDDS